MVNEVNKTICSVGTGTVGPGITLAFALAGYNTHMYGRSADSVEQAYNKIHGILNQFEEKGLIAKADIFVVLSRIKRVTSLEEATDGAEFVIESIVEDLHAKRELFLELEGMCARETILASSTSGLIPSEIAERLKYKDRFLVTHFWNPPHLIPLVEVVPGKDTSESTVETTALLLRKIGKKPVILEREILGFIGNRLQFAMLREAFALIESGVASQEAIDDTVKYALGRRLSTTGPFESCDLSGLDIISSISAYLFPDLCSNPEQSRYLSELINTGQLGAKTGTGFYKWTENSLSKLKKLREEDLIGWLKKDKLNYLG